MAPRAGTARAPAATERSNRRSYDAPEPLDILVARWFKEIENSALFFTLYSIAVWIGVYNLEVEVNSFDLCWLHRRLTRTARSG